MIIVRNYRGFRIEIVAQLVGNQWDARVQICSRLTNEVRRSAYLSCRKATAAEAERNADAWARRLMDGMARLSRLVEHAKERRRSDRVRTGAVPAVPVI